MPVPPPSTVNRAVSPELDAIVLQALERDRKLRYPRAAHMARDLDVFLQAHRFAVEDMAEYLKEVFPVEAREDMPDRRQDLELLDPLRPGSPTAASSPRAISGTPSALRAERVQADVAAARRRALTFGGAALLALGVAAVVVVPLLRPNRAAPETTTQAPQCCRRAAGAPGRSRRQGARQRSSARRARRRRGASHVGAAGAQVYAGPKLVGTAPVTLHLGKGGAASVTLVHPGYKDLNYTVQPGDGPSLTLRLMRHRHGFETAVHNKSAPACVAAAQGPAQDPNRHLRRQREAAARPQSASDR